MLIASNFKQLIRRLEKDMMSKKVELMVGFFVALGIAALLMLSLKVANSGISGGGESYNLFAKFDNIGGVSFNGTANIVPTTIVVADTTNTKNYLGMLILWSV